MILNLELVKQGFLVSSANKFDRSDKTYILLKVALTLNTTDNLNKIKMWES